MLQQPAHHALGAGGHLSDASQRLQGELRRSPAEAHVDKRLDGGARGRGHGARHGAHSPRQTRGSQISGGDGAGGWGWLGEAGGRHRVLGRRHAGHHGGAEVGSLGRSGGGEVLAQGERGCLQLLGLVHGLHWAGLGGLQQQLLNQQSFLLLAGLQVIGVINTLHRRCAVHHHLLQHVPQGVLMREQHLDSLHTGQPLLLLPQQRSVDTLGVVC